MLGRFEESLRHFEVVERTERRRATAQLRAQSQFFVTRTESQQAQWQAEQARLEAQAQRARAAEFAESAERDPLTGLGNRRHLARRCAELLPAAEREARPLAVAQLDIDHFKLINDRHGHATGDRVLVTLAQLLRDNTRNRDVLVRHGGEEFVLVMPGMSLDGAAEVCERLRDCVASHQWDGADVSNLTITVSIGLAAAPSYEVGPLLHRADQALYRAKRSGRNRVELEAA
jgi:diguanylate cyclase (GGDEF)-like protein